MIPNCLDHYFFMNAVSAISPWFVSANGWCSRQFGMRRHTPSFWASRPLMSTIVAGTVLLTAYEEVDGPPFRDLLVRSPAPNTRA